MEEVDEEMDKEMDEEVDEEEWRAPTSRGRPESIMWGILLSGHREFLKEERRSGWRRLKTPTSRGRPESIMRDMDIGHDAFRPTETP